LGDRLSDPKHHRQPFIDGGDDPDGHLRRGVPVAGADATAAVNLGMAAAFVPHHLVDHASWNAGVLKPGGKRVAKVMGAMWIELAQVIACSGDGVLVDAAEVVPGQHGPCADRDPIATAGAGEDQRVGVAVGWELPPDGLDKEGTQGELADAGVALGAWLEAAAELAAGLVAHVDHLEDGKGPIEVDATAA